MKFEDVVRQNHKKSLSGSVAIIIILVLLGGFMIWGRAVISIIFGVVMLIVAVGLFMDEMKLGNLNLRMDHFYRGIDQLGDRTAVLDHIDQIKPYSFEKHTKTELRFDEAYLAYSCEDKVMVVPGASMVKGHEYRFKHAAFGIIRTNVDYSVRLIFNDGENLRRMDIPCKDENESKKLLEEIHQVYPDMVIEAPKEDGRKRSKREPKGFKKTK